ncbi:hypothetical protein WA538_004430 [Blastocystis sp. DL]
MVPDKKPRIEPSAQLAITYTCDCCHQSIPLYSSRVKCLECDDTDICMQCYEMRKETETHKYGHRVVVVPVLPETASTSWDDNDDVDGGATDVEVEPYDELIHDYLQSTADNREFASSIDADLALEILDGLCYYQYDIEGLWKSLSKRIPYAMLTSYVFDVVLRDSKASPVDSFQRQNDEESEPLREKVFTESFSPTILECMMKDMTLENCNPEVMFCLKEMEPLLQKNHPPLFSKAQIPFLLSLTLSDSELKARLKALQRMKRNAFTFRKDGFQGVESEFT